MPEPGDRLSYSLDLDISGWRRNLREASSLGNQFGRSITRAFEGAIFGGKSLSDTLKGLALSLSRLAFRQAFKPLESAVGSIFNNVLSGITGFAKGGVINGGAPVPFAKGGVIAGPAAFALGRGRIGLAGEAGPEAILPLARGSDGRLGVKAGRGSGDVVINFNVTSPDADSFRRSETQIAAMLNRAVSRGQRNL